MATQAPTTAAADMLVDTAERLIGEHGLEAVSLRQISRAAGQGNNYAVQYHFGDLAGLIRAIQDRRMPAVERLRSALLAKVRAAGRQDDTRALTEVLYLPLLDLLDASGERRFARFVLAMLSLPDVERFGDGLVEAMPSAMEALELLCALHPALSMELILERQRLLAIMVLTSVFNRRPPFDLPDNDAAAIDNALAMASAALAAPVGSGVAAIV
ncbi:TetR/AcrR family transcriptional regulator [Novosphingobium sp. G106]|uniref:helix-turn-helix domain-containing protein n=1 Tax=Novosphingobium sp. G106 TaxID=2849500 RepID=UPI001C2D462B|nr:helix-turn-helix domain-containing protein [Novosphingobium sp. G106]MBV1686547.1 TetR/AcrR family transcriptional regulator [Novosphingobium sp. G106]